MADAIRHSADGIPYLAPEIVLFTKTTHARDKDVVDQNHLVPTLDPRARRWLHDAIAMVHPGHDRLRVVAA
jgi:hypothetical protein